MTSPGPKDGTDLGACTDGDCEVFVSGKMEFTPAAKFGVTRVRLTLSGDKRTEFYVLRKNASGAQGYIDGTGYLSLSGSFTIRVQRRDADGAVLKFEAKFDDKKNDTASGSDGISLYSV